MNAAKTKCGDAIQQLAGLAATLPDVRHAAVVGDGRTGTVTLPFTVSGRVHLAVCVFEHGETKGITLDGKLIGGRAIVERSAGCPDQAIDRRLW